MPTLDTQSVHLHVRDRTQTRAQIEAADALYVKIVDIQVGKASTKKDPHGFTWSTFDPLAHVGFYNPKCPDTGPLSLNSEYFPQIYLPAASHTRTLWCYLRTEEPGWRSALEQALNLWKLDAGLTEQQGTSNTASPAHFAAAGRKANTTPRAMPGSRGRPTNLYSGAFSAGGPADGRDGNHNRRLSSISESSASTRAATAEP